MNPLHLATLLLAPVQTDVTEFAWNCDAVMATSLIVAGFDEQAHHRRLDEFTITVTLVATGCDLTMNYCDGQSCGPCQNWPDPELEVSTTVAVLAEGVPGFSSTQYRIFPAMHSEALPQQPVPCTPVPFVQQGQTLDWCNTVETVGIASTLVADAATVELWSGGRPLQVDVARGHGFTLNGLCFELFGTCPCGDGEVTIEWAWSCAGDLTQDGRVGFGDQTLLLGRWGPCPGCRADLDGNGFVQLNDLVILLDNWGMCQ